MDAKVTRGLRRIYADAQKEGIWILEFKAEKDFLAAAGWMQVIEAKEKEIGVEIDIPKFSLGDAISLEAVPGVGKTREAACRRAVKLLKTQRD